MDHPASKASLMSEESEITNQTSKVENNSDRRGDRRQHIFFYILLLRLANVLLVQTSFVPDEYWQSVEVAHRYSFGNGFLTWEWRHGLRSFAYPAIFSVGFNILHYLGLDSVDMIVYLPRIMQAIVSAIGDWYLYAFARDHFGGNVARFVLLSHSLSWFWWYCSSRTLTNTLESAILCVGLYFYPWPSSPKRGNVLYQCLAILTCAIRPTAAIVWIPMAMWHMFLVGKRRVCSTLSSYLILSLVIVGALTALDGYFYGRWMLTQWNFFMFNVWEHRCDMFGSHPWHWYLTQGIPAVIGTNGVFFIWCIGHCLSNNAPYPKAVLNCLCMIFCATILSFSLLRHKEFRFILQLVPISSVFCGIRIASLSAKGQRYSMVFLILTNLPVAMYTGLIHQRGTLDVMNKLHQSLDIRCNPSCQGDALILAPCYSTPLYSHIHKNISLRFLTCDPNIDDDQARISETELFYENPNEWLDSYVGGDERQVLPHHIVMFDKLFEELQDWKFMSRYDVCARSFHTHIPEDRSGEYIYLLCLKALS